jgi:hypothetical protein
MRYLPVLIALLVVVGYSVAEGLWTNRWELSDDTGEAAARLAGVPRTVGEWEGKDEELDARQIARAEIVGYVMRQYTHQRSGAVIGVLLVCGRPGPTSVHTPEICFPGSGLAMQGQAERHAVNQPGKQSDEFWVASFQRTGAVTQPQRVYWAWNATGTWVAAEQPRVQFAMAGALFKLYVSRGLSRPDEPLAEDPSDEFMAAFLPAVRKCLFPAS